MRCLDPNRFHFTSGDTDSIYITVVSYPTMYAPQSFDVIIIDREFYDKWSYTFMSNPAINTIEDTKKLLGFCVEKYGYDQVAKDPKTCTIWNNDGSTVGIKLNGIVKKTNNIISSDFSKVISKGTVVKGINT